MTHQEPIITPPAIRDREFQLDDESSSDDRDTLVITPQRTVSSATESQPTPHDDAPFLPAQTSAETDERWRRIQAQFVDDPRRSVGEAHALVGELTQRIVDAFAKERSDLERQWSSGGDVSTEELRVCLQRYRSFFARLLPSVQRLNRTEESA